MAFLLIAETIFFIFTKRPKPTQGWFILQSNVEKTKRNYYEIVLFHPSWRHDVRFAFAFSINWLSVGCSHCYSVMTVPGGISWCQLACCIKRLDWTFLFFRCHLTWPSCTDNSSRHVHALRAHAYKLWFLKGQYFHNQCRLSKGHVICVLV